MKEGKSMKNEVLEFPPVRVPAKNEFSSKSLILLAIACVSGGIAAILTGFVFTIIHAALKDDSVFNFTGTILLMAAIPAMILGGHFMDKAAKKSKSEKKN